MPFVTGAGAAEPGGVLGSGVVGSATMRVDPESIIELANELTSIHDEVKWFLAQEGRAMRVLPPGADPVSKDGAEAFNHNAETALEAGYRYVEELAGLIDSLNETARLYGLTEQANTDAFLRRAGT